MARSDIKGLFLGMMTALAFTPSLFISFGITNMLAIYAVFTCAGTILVIVLPGKKTVSKEEKTIISTFTLGDLWSLSKMKDFLILEYGFFACVGGFTAIMTWLEEILHSLHNISVENAGIAGGMLIIGGIIGSIVIPSVSDKIKKIKPFVLMDLAVGTLTLYLLSVIKVFNLIAMLCFITGFFLMSALPLVLEISSRISGRGMEGRASSLLWFFPRLAPLY